MTSCPFCKAPLTASVAPWSYHCRPCDHWVSTFSPARSDIENTEFESLADGQNVIEFLDSVRRATAGIILKSLDQLKSLGQHAGRKLLDVGCAAGIFVDTAASFGFDAFGVEPNKKMATPGIRRGLNIRTGFFPEAIGSEQFEIITFNDVLEHIEDVHTILDSCNRTLTPAGHLCINVPNSGGLFFRLARIMGYCGLQGPWNRLWQTMFYTPHLHYFSSTSLALLASTHGFRLVAGPTPLPVLTLSGLWQRLSVDPQSSFAKNVILYILIVAIFPLYLAAPKDSFFMIFQKQPKP